jgi:hypothetical protein
MAATAARSSAVPTRTAMRADATMPGKSAAVMPAEAVASEPAMGEAAMMTVRKAVVAVKVAVPRDEHDSAVRVVVVVVAIAVVGLVADGLRCARRHGQTDTEH